MSTSAPKPPELRPYQREAIRAIGRELTSHRSTLLVLPTGTGKTVTFIECARRVVANRKKPVLVLAHRSELLDQAEHTAKAFGLRVGIEQASKHVDLTNLPDVVVASVQSLQRARLAAFPRDTFGLLVCDEAHRSFAKSYRNVLDHFTAKYLGVTATPDRADGEALGDVFESVAYKMELAEAVAGGWLAPLEVVSITVGDLDVSDIKMKDGDFDTAALQTELLRDGILHAVAKPFAEQYEGRQTICFTAGVDQAYALAQVLGEYGVKAAAIDGEMDKKRRAAVIADYEAGRIQVICNAAILTEGYDSPNTQCVALVRPTKSRGLIMQCIGRGTRLAEGKANCLILNFTPEELGAKTIATPADVLAGCEWKKRADVGNEKKLAAEQAAKAETAHVQRLINTLGVEYAVMRYPLCDVLRSKLGFMVGVGDPASEAQAHALKQMGFNFDKSPTREEARVCFDIVAKRKSLGLCTIKQAKKLTPHGFEDNIGLEEANALMGELERNKWKPPQRWYAKKARVA